jgi:hypothetical protein
MSGSPFQLVPERREKAFENPNGKSGARGFQGGRMGPAGMLCPPERTIAAAAVLNQNAFFGRMAVQQAGEEEVPCAKP